MAPPGAPTAPRKMATAKTRPQVVITTSPPKPAATPVQTVPGPPDFYGMLQRAVKRDANKVITSVWKLPLFAEAAAGLCAMVKAFPGTPADRARFLGSIGWRFSDETFYPRLSDQTVLCEAFSGILPLLDRSAAEESSDVKAFFSFADAIIVLGERRREKARKDLEEARRRAQDKDVEMLGTPASRPVKRRANADPDGKPKMKKLKVTPSLTNHVPGTDAALALLAAVDQALDLVQLAEDEIVPRSDLQKHRDAVDLAAQHQLYQLDVALQTFRMISDRRARLEQALGPSDVDQTSSLFHALQVPLVSGNEDSDVEFQDSTHDGPEDTVAL